MWLDVKVHLPDRVREELFPASRGGTHSHEARNLTAILNDKAGKPLPNVFFNYDESGQTLPGRPLVRFGSFTRGISVVGVGRQGVDLVDSLAHKLRRMWSDHVGEPLLETRSEGRNAIRWSPYPRRYVVHGLAMNVKTKWDFEKAGGLDHVRPMVARVIAEGLLAEVDSVHGDDHSIRDSEVLNELNESMVGFEGAERLVYRRLNTDAAESKAAITVLRRATFTLPFELEGVWHVGRLPSRGFGLVRSERAYGTQERA